MNDDDKAWVRSWPMLLVAGLLLIGGAYAYKQDAENGAAPAALIGAGLIIMGGWFAVEVYRLDRKVAKKVQEVRDDNADSG